MFSAPQVACLRSGVAALALLAMLPASRRGWRWRPAGTWAIAAAYAATLVGFVTATKLTTAAAAISLQATAPLYLLLLGPLLLREPIRGRDLAFIAALAAGLAAVFAGAPQAQATAPDPAGGNLAGALTGLTWAVTVTGLRWAARGEAGHAGPGSGGASARIVVAGNALATLACLPGAHPFPAAGAADWALIGYLGVFQIGLAYTFLTRAIRHLPALEASLLLLVEPVLNPIWAWMLHGEAPGLWPCAGGALILGATTLRMVADRARAPV